MEGNGMGVGGRWEDRQDPDGTLRHGVLEMRVLEMRVLEVQMLVDLFNSQRFSEGVGGGEPLAAKVTSTAHPARGTGGRHRHTEGRRGRRGNTGSVSEAQHVLDFGDLLVHGDANGAGGDDNDPDRSGGSWSVVGLASLFQQDTTKNIPKVARPAATRAATFIVAGYQLIVILMWTNVVGAISIEKGADKLLLTERFLRNGAIAER